jgi:large conductance mechanosensitive channel
VSGHQVKRTGARLNESQRAIGKDGLDLSSDAEGVRRPRSGCAVALPCILVREIASCVGRECNSLTDSGRQVRRKPTMAGVFQEFKQFAIKGNVMDLAVGVIIGGAFSTIVNSIVKDLIMPIVGIVTGNIDFSNKFVRIGALPASFKGNPDSYKDLQTAGVAVVGYGSFITVVLNFLILAFIVFLLVKFINKLRELEKTEPDTPAAPAAPPEDVLLLREIRDELKDQRQRV